MLITFFFVHFYASFSPWYFGNCIFKEFTLNLTDDEKKIFEHLENRFPKKRILKEIITKEWKCEERNIKVYGIHNFRSNVDNCDQLWVGYLIMLLNCRARHLFRYESLSARSFHQIFSRDASFLLQCSLFSNTIVLVEFLLLWYYSQLEKKQFSSYLPSVLWSMQWFFFQRWTCLTLSEKKKVFERSSLELVIMWL